MTLIQLENHIDHLQAYILDSLYTNEYNFIAEFILQDGTVKRNLLSLSNTAVELTRMIDEWIYFYNPSYIITSYPTKMYIDGDSCRIGACNGYSPNLKEFVCIVMTVINKDNNTTQILASRIDNEKYYSWKEFDVDTHELIT